MGRIIINILLMVEYLSFFYVAFRREIRPFSVRRAIGLVIWGMVWVGPLLSGFNWQGNVWGPVSAFFPMAVLIVWIVFELSIIEALLIGVFNWLILSFLESSFIVALKSVYNIGDATLTGFIMLATTGLIWLIYLLSRGKYNVQAFRLPIKVWILLDMIMLILMTMLSFFGYIIVENLADSGMSSLGQRLLLMSGVSIIILLFAFVYFYSSSYIYRTQKEITEIQIKQQKDYFDQIIAKEEETKKFRHDIINDLLELKNYCDNHDYDQMEQYLAKVTGVITEISKKSYDIGNEVVNTIINYYLNVPDRPFRVEVNGHMPETVLIDERDLCLVCANMIKNAVEAVDKMENGKIWIDVSPGSNYLAFSVKNTYKGDIVFDKKGFPITSKKDKEHHGIGIHSISDIVKKNGGLYSMSTSNGIFEAEVYLKYICA